MGMYIIALTSNLSDNLCIMTKIFLHIKGKTFGWQFVITGGDSLVKPDWNILFPQLKNMPLGRYHLIASVCCCQNPSPMCDYETVRNFSTDVDSVYTEYNHRNFSDLV